MESILTSIKKMLGIEEEYTHFDVDIIMHINSILFILSQLGVGPPNGFSITDKSAKWSDFIGEKSNLELIKSYVHLKVTLLFDPPLNAAVINSTKEMINEFEWRIQVEADKKTNFDKEDKNNE